MNVLLPEETINSNNICYNLDANELIKSIKGDLLYLDPPYNSSVVALGQRADEVVGEGGARRLLGGRDLDARTS